MQIGEAVEERPHHLGDQHRARREARHRCEDLRRGDGAGGASGSIGTLEIGAVGSAASATGASRNGRVNRISGWPGDVMIARATYSPGGSTPSRICAANARAVAARAPACASTLTSAWPFSRIRDLQRDLGLAEQCLIAAGHLEHRRHGFGVDHAGGPRPRRVAGDWRLRHQHQIRDVEPIRALRQSRVDRVMHAAAAAAARRPPRCASVYSPGSSEHRRQRSVAAIPRACSPAAASTRRRG